MLYTLITILILIIVILPNIRQILSYYENLEEKNEADFKSRTGLDLWKLTKIYPEETIIGSKHFFIIKPESFYYDDDFFYKIRTDNTIIKHKISNIVEVTRTSFTRNDKRIWKIIINESDKKTEYKIPLTITLSNNNFADFLEKVNQNSDSVVDSEWLL